MQWSISMLGSLAWPLATLALALIFREDLKKAMGRVGQVKYRDLELTFRDDLRQAEALAKSIPPLPPSKNAPVLEVDVHEGKTLTGHLIGDYPAIESPTTTGSTREAIDDAWKGVVRALLRAATVPGDRRASSHLDPAVAARVLVDQGRLPATGSLLVAHLRALRDRANRPDEPDPSADDARRFGELSRHLAASIEPRA